MFSFMVKNEAKKLSKCKFLKNSIENNDKKMHVKRGLCKF